MASLWEQLGRKVPKQDKEESKKKKIKKEVKKKKVVANIRGTKIYSDGSRD